MRATQHRNPGHLAGEAGYTLVEALVSVFLMTMILGGMYSMLFQSQATFDAQQDAMGLRQQARVAMDEMATQIRMAGASIDNLPSPLVLGAAETVIFVADIDAGSAAPPCGAATENALNGGAERITFRVVNGALLRSIDCWDGANWTAEYTDQVLARDLIDGGPRSDTSILMASNWYRRAILPLPSWTWCTPLASTCRCRTPKRMCCRTVSWGST